MAEFYPSITPVPVDNLPSNEELLKAMVPLLEESDNWTLGKSFTDETFGVEIQTFSRKRTPKDGAMWHGRVSDHPKDSVGGFEPFWNGVGVDHTINEQEYVHDLDQLKLLKLFSEERQLWMLHFALSPPVSHRQFTILVATHLEKDSTTGLRTGYVISIPVDISSNAELKDRSFHVTQGAYSAIERVKEMPDGSINWRTVTTSTAGGWVPQLFAELAMPQTIAKDVTYFLEWLAQNPTGMRADMVTRMSQTDA